MAISHRIVANNPSDLYNGIMNTTLRLLFDKSMNALQGDRWMEKKRAIAFENARKEMIKGKFNDQDHTENGRERTEAVRQKTEV